MWLDGTCCSCWLQLPDARGSCSARESSFCAPLSNAITFQARNDQSSTLRTYILLRQAASKLTRCTRISHSSKCADPTTRLPRLHISPSPPHQRIALGRPQRRKSMTRNWQSLAGAAARVVQSNASSTTCASWGRACTHARVCSCATTAAPSERVAASRHGWLGQLSVPEHMR